MAWFNTSASTVESLDYQAVPSMGHEVEWILRHWLNVIEVYRTTVSTCRCSPDARFCCHRFAAMLLAELSDLCGDAKVHGNHQKPNIGTHTHLASVLLLNPHSILANVESKDEIKT
ncbi:hypothetical protein LOK49_LG06G03222 [Camellia lanceoleosa]|uniref:Uncharacterized protein n=1 Tax=Camellia lanceoleosa TaxID=1840588 RepID=A0ACC0HJR1_9ERIC|nr:hypothetical protein LOK49_LG06G03222 [Camellia lanceoleosa]